MNVQDDTYDEAGRRWDQIRLTGVSATGYHGVFAHERREGQTFVADVVLHVDTRRAAANDDLAHTVDYGEVALLVAAVLSGEPVDLVETVAERIAATVLARPGVHAVDVAVHKPQAPITVPFGDVVVSIRRDRSKLPAAEPYRPATGQVRRPADPEQQHPRTAPLPLTDVAPAFASVDVVHADPPSAATATSPFAPTSSDPVPSTPTPSSPFAPTSVGPVPSAPTPAAPVPAGPFAPPPAPAPLAAPPLPSHLPGPPPAAPAAPVTSPAGPDGPGSVVVGPAPTGAVPTGVVPAVGIAAGPVPAHVPVPDAARTELMAPVTDVVDAEIVLDALDEPPAQPVRAVLALGSNIGPAQETLRQAVADIAATPGVEVVAVSPLARTAAVGPEQPDFLNAVVLARTTLSPRDLLRAAHAVEDRHGRERHERWGPRTLDVDVIVHGDTLAVTDDLELPHPRAHERAFVLQPWAQIDPEAQLPGLGGGPVAQLAATAPDRDGVRWMALDWLTAPVPAANPEPDNASQGEAHLP
ncbi:2-amino-4-hydroxy-6-hydroxymethyldihydropteridin epyrophosphokinase [Cellulomonas flavigena DSM 20109]|uniref:Bifunctional folate synthesis protein n=1 Tax=Cellulomonas flavigena (strain ATCC 482 / DSM 20109 / BCRC 11376 / JCM 18109 / NBRC 3775 / NCIMB 8073 / NRS 134) TaxID=446466 RepID=D5UIP3_CELFN|nr:2-amino-4-hydroxy-6-hydroxymethyldihydropteridine diphosphokinase [Cellulomonas flavigena]ADG73542.1 2-amino-4-hydroxy-6-hydroxymethyldihydropteridin epyrophosphokinase [Cellulomonas flavigena DSM 20109]